MAAGQCTGIPSGAQAIVGNATSLNSKADGYITLYPSGVGQPPPVSNVNYMAGQVIPNSFTVALGSDGAFQAYAYSTTDMIVDVAGYYSTQASDANGPGLQYNALPAPVRLLWTDKPSNINETVCLAPPQPLAGGTSTSFVATGSCTGIPTSAQAIVGNATSLNSTADGYLTLYPSGVGGPPPVSNVNYMAGQVIPNSFTMGLGSDGAFQAYAYSTTDLIVDVAGYFAP